MSTPADAELVSKKTPAARKPRAWKIANIIDGRALRVKLTAAAEQHAADQPAARKAALEHLHRALFRGRLIAQERLQQGADGLDTARLLSAVQDEVISALYDFTTTHMIRARNPTEGERLAIVATGGYGRGVLAPSSDIDLLFIRSYKQTPHTESVVEFMLYALWDMGLKVGNAFRTPEECVRLAKTDVTIKTSLIDARLICGDEGLSKETSRLFRREAVSGHDAQFIADKLAERDTRHTRQGDARYVVEPNIKEGKGGLRDLQTLFWIMKHIHGGDTLEQVMRANMLTSHEYQVFMRAARFFWTVRCHVHYLTGRAEERLSFDLQPEIAARMGYSDRGAQLGVERFMKRYFLAAKDVGGLTRILAAKLEAAQKKKPEGLRKFLPSPAPKPIEGTPFLIEAGRISVEDGSIFQDDPVNMIRLFVEAERQDVDIHPDALSDVTRNLRLITADLRKSDPARNAFLDALLSGSLPGRTLMRMNEAGVLGKLVPEFGGIVAQTQFNMYHHYTVDEHTLRAVATISDIEHGRASDHPLPTKIFGEIEGRRALYLAMLLHDTGKGLGDQQVEGMKTARRACKRLGLDKAETELVAWLVGNHLEMSETAQKRDISDPRTVSDFAELVGSLERLRLLYVLTVADICAVGPTVWNAWKGQLLSELYHATAAALRGGRSDEYGVAAALEDRAEQQREALADRLGSVPATMLEFDTAYWTAFDLDTLSEHAALVSSAGSSAVVDVSEQTSGTVLVASGPDRIGVFADVAGMIAWEGASIASAQVFSSISGRFLDVFILQDARGAPYAAGDTERLGRLKASVLSAIEGTGPGIDLKTRNERRRAAFLVRPQAQIHTDKSATCLVVDVAGRDKVGLVYDLASVFAEADLSIDSAHIASYGERVFDAFYVRSRSGGKAVDETALERLKERLLAVLGREEPDAPKTPARSLRRAAAADSF